MTNRQCKRQLNCGASIGGRAGFSLLELLVVLAIMAAAMAVAVPKLGGGPPRSAVQSMAVLIATDLREMRDEALRTNTEQVFTLDLGRRTTSSMARPIPRNFVRGVDVDVTGPSLEWGGDRAVRIRFLPGGGATGSEITVRDSTSVARISVDWLTGVARIEKAR